MRGCRHILLCSSPENSFEFAVLAGGRATSENFIAFVLEYVGKAFSHKVCISPVDPINGVVCADNRQRVFNGIECGFEVALAFKDELGQKKPPNQHDAAGDYNRFDEYERYINQNIIHVFRTSLPDADFRISAADGCR